MRDFFVFKNYELVGDRRNFCFRNIKISKSTWTFIVQLIALFGESR